MALKDEIEKLSAESQAELREMLAETESAADAAPGVVERLWGEIKPHWRIVVGVAVAVIVFGILSGVRA